MRLLLAGLFSLASAVGIAACDTTQPCAIACARPPLTGSDDVAWELAVFHVKVCIGAICEEVDAPRGGAAVTLTTLDGSVRMSVGASGAGSHFDLILHDAAYADGGANVHTGDIVHVVVTDPGTGVTVCDMTAQVIDVPVTGCSCLKHQLAAFTDYVP